MMGDAPARRRDAALAGLRGDAATATALLHDPDPGVRATALGAVDRCGSLAADVLAAALHDHDRTVRRRAATLAAHHPDVALDATLEDPDPLVAEAAAWAAGERPEDPRRPAAVAALLRLAADHDDTLVREAAVAALGSLEAPEGRDAVLDAMHDRPNVRRRAVLALAAYDGPEVLDALREAAGDRDWQVRDAATDLLRILDPDGDHLDAGPGGGTDLSG